MKRIGLFFLVGFLFFQTADLRADYNYEGALASHNDVLTFAFTTDRETVVSLFTTSWFDSGLDLMLSVWDANGNLLGWTDDCEDAFPYSSGSSVYFVGELDPFYTDTFAAGQYFATVTVGGNWASGNNLSDGFDYDADEPLSIEVWDSAATNQVSFNIVGATNVSIQDGGDDTVVPEPGTLALLGLGMASLPFIRRRIRKSLHN